MSDYHAELTIHGRQAPFLVVDEIPMRKYAGGRYGTKVIQGFEVAIYVNPIRQNDLKRICE